MIVIIGTHVSSRVRTDDIVNGSVLECGVDKACVDIRMYIV